MKRMYEFMCSNGHITESYLDESIRETTCSTCGNDASRIISMPRISLDGTDPVYVSAHERWARNREEATKMANKRNEG